MTQEMVVRQETANAIQSNREFTVSEVFTMTNKVKEIMAKIMVEGEHYGIIPGCKKASLWQPGAEKLCVAFRLKPSYVVTSTDYPEGHREYMAVCTLTHIPTGDVFGEGIGSCCTLESKYRYRGEGRICPKCGAGALIKGKDEFGGGWLCFKKKGGCGAKFADGDAEVEKQEGGKVENPDIADTYNTVLQIACKRAYVKAARSSTAASDIFSDVIGDPDDPQGDARPYANGDAKKAAAVQQPQRKSTQTTAPAEKAQASDPRAELTILCLDIARAGMTVATTDHKTFSLVQSDGDDASMVCSKLSSFVGRDNTVIPGKSPMDLSDKAVYVTLKKAKEVHEQLANVTATDADFDQTLPDESPEQESPPDEGQEFLYHCVDCERNFDNPVQKKIKGYIVNHCACGSRNLMAWEDWKVAEATK